MPAVTAVRATVEPSVGIRMRWNIMFPFALVHSRHFRALVQNCPITHPGNTLMTTEGSRQKSVALNANVRALP